MANAAEDSTGYAGGGAGGKFRKKPSKRPPSTPYDRPATARRNTPSIISNGGSNGWISRIVDPASKLLSFGARKLFSSLTRKRLPPPPPQSSPDNMVESPENHLRDEMTDDGSRIQERDKSEGKGQNNGPVTDGVAELEPILNQRTYTRDDIGRISVLLQSRIVDNAGIAGQRRFELTPYEPPVGRSRQDELVTAACGNKANPSDILGSELTPAVRPKVNDDDIASPAEIAKAYMGSMSKAVSVSMLGSHVQADREETHALTRFQPHSPVMHTVQKPLSTPVRSQNDFVIPRSRGRSALYSMARTPYSRVLPTQTKALVTSNGASIGRSLSASQKALKRRSSVLESDIGAVGPIRRIRQKSNLFYPKAVGQSSRTPLTHTTSSEVGEASLYSSQEDRGDKSKPVSSMHVSSKSIEMGQRILQQLEKMTPPKEKSSEKKLGTSGGISSMDLTPSIVQGQAHKSTETVNSLKYIHSGLVSGKIVDSSDTLLHKVQDSTSEKQEKVHGITGEVVVNSSKRVRHENGDVKNTDNDAMGNATNAAPVVLKSAVDVPKKSQASQGYLELDGDTRSNGAVSLLINEGKLSLDTSSANSNGNVYLENHSLPGANTANKPAFPELKPPSSFVLKKNTEMELSTSPEKGIDCSFPTSSAVNKTMESSAPPAQPVTTSVSTKADVPASSISFGLLSSDKVSPATMFSASAVESHSQLPNSSSAFASGLSDAGTKSPGSNNKTKESVELLRKLDSTVMENSGSDTAGKLPVFGTLTSNRLPGTTSPTPSFTNTGFQFGLSATMSNHLQASHNVSSEALPSNTTSASTTESIPSQPAASAFSGSTNISGSLQTTNPPVSAALGFGVSSASTPISASPGFAFGSSPISTPANGSIAGNEMPSKTNLASTPSSPFGFVASSSSSASVFSFSSAASASASVPASTIPQSPPPSFGNGTSVFAFGSNNDQLKMNDTMTEDSMQRNQAPASSGANPFQFSSQQNPTPAPSGANNPFHFSSQQNQAPIPSGANPFQFSSQQNQSPVPSGANPFQFSSQQNQASATTGTNPFQFSSSQQNQAPALSGGVPFQFNGQMNQAPAPQNPFQNNDSSGGGSFSLGAGGNDKTNRRIIKVRNRIKKR